MRCLYLIIMGLILIFIMAVSGENNEASLYCDKGVRLYGQKDYSGAEEAFQKALSINGEYVDAQKGLCKAMEALGECDDLPNCCQKLHGLDQSKETRYVITNLLKSPKCYQQTHGTVEYTSENYDTLLEIYNESIAMNRNDTEGWNGKGIALGELSRLDESLECFNEVIRVKNTSSEVAAAWNNIGVSLDKMDRHREALEAYNRSIQIDPELAEAWHNKGKTLSLDINAFDAAHECDQNALKINPKLSGEMLEWVYKEF